MLSRSIRLNAKNQPSKLTETLGDKRRGRSHRHFQQRMKTNLGFVVVHDELGSLDAPRMKPRNDSGGGSAFTNARIKVVAKRKEGARFGGSRPICHRRLSPAIVGRWRGVFQGRESRQSRRE